MTKVGRAGDRGLSEDACRRWQHQVPGPFGPTETPTTFVMTVQPGDVYARLANPPPPAPPPAPPTARLAAAGAAGNGSAAAAARTPGGAGAELS